MQNHYRLTPQYENSERNQSKLKYQLTVRGQGEVTVKPDQAKLTVGIVTENQNVEAAQQENAATTNRVINALKQLGIDDRSIKTSHYSIQPLYDYIGGKSVFRSYQVDHQLEVSVSDIARVGLVYQVAVNNGANRGGNIKFSVTNTDMYYRQALSRAVEDARKKAEEIIRSIGAVLNQLPIKMTEDLEQTNRPIPFQTFKLAAAEAEEAPPIQQGEYTIDAQVTVVYQYQGRYN